MKTQAYLEPLMKAGRPVAQWFSTWRKPKFVKEAEMVHKSVQRFINYRRDLLKPEVLEVIEGLNKQLQGGIQDRDSNEIKTATDALTKVCKKAAPKDYRASALAENIEVIFVALAIALGIRAYIAQPFKIPTGSMQPTLNGIIAERTEEPKQPNPIIKAIDAVRLGRTWVNAVVKEDDVIVDIREHTVLRFFTYTKIVGQKHVYTVHAPAELVYTRLGLEEVVPASYSSDRWWVNHVKVKEGQVLARGYVDTGDQVIVDKFSYHFFPPKRGEVFVFTTQDIRRIPVNPEMGSIHYIKRLAGLPGDTIEIKEGDLYVNGELGKEFGFRRVMTKEDGYHGYGPEFTGRFRDVFVGYRSHDFELKERQYYALGDNSGNSQDSRAWGHVPEDNLVGRALVVYWPFNKHWGVIR